MSDVTRILDAIEGGDAQAASALLPLVYDQLRQTARQRMAAERVGHSLDATALVHEAYMRLLGENGEALQWANRAHFYAAAAQAMRRILVEHARARGRVKRGGDRGRLSLSVATLGVEDAAEDLVALEEALQRLEAIDKQAANVVSLRYYAGLSVEETAQALQTSPRSVKREWSLARAWLFRELNGSTT